MPTERLTKLLEIIQAGEAGLPLVDAEAALFLRVKKTTMPVWRAQKKGPPFFLVGSSPRYLLSDLKMYLAQKKPQKKVSANVGRPSSKSLPR